MKVYVILNEQHQLLEEQKQILQERFEKYEIVSVPSEGWTAKEQKEIAKKLIESNFKVTTIFASPVPVLLKEMAFWSGYGEAGAEQGIPAYGAETEVLVFHNDDRDKKELPNGKIIMTVAQEGWQLI